MSEAAQDYTSSDYLDRADYLDRYAEMESRRLINELTRHPQEFNQIGLMLAKQFITYDSGSTILDIGSSSGLHIMSAAKEEEIPARIIGIDPYDEAHRVYRERHRDSEIVAQLPFVRGYGEHLPFPANSFETTTAFNSVFRSSDIPAFLTEMWRVTKNNGLVIISTNAKDHAKRRHWLEEIVAEKLNVKTEYSVEPSHPPAKKFFLEDAPGIIAQMPGLEVIHTHEQSDESEITIENLDLFCNTINYTGETTNLPENFNKLWRAAVREDVLPIIRSLIEEPERTRLVFDDNGHPTGEMEPYFADKIHRGILLMRVHK